MLSEDHVIIASQSAVCLSDICRKLNICQNTNNRKLISAILKRNSIQLSGYKTPQKWEQINKTCPVCKTVFLTLKNHPREKSTCSYSCANTYFRSGKNNPNYKDGSELHGSSNYRKSALESFGAICARCSYKKIPGILQVHHIDRDRSNNRLENLIVLCPTCHQEDHYLAKDGLWHEMKSSKVVILDVNETQAYRIELT